MPSSTLFEENKSGENEKRILSVDGKASDINKELNWIETQKNSNYLPDIKILQDHKSVSVRRKVVDLVASFGSEEDLDFLAKWKESEPDRATFLKIESAIDRIKRKKRGAEVDSVDVLSVGEALGYIKSVVSERKFTIKGEISESNTYGSMYFFKLKDSDSVVMDCWCFSGIVLRAGFPLNEGLEIKVTGQFKISNKSSRLIFDVKKLELTGEGEFLRNLKILEQNLRDEGLMDESRKRKPNILPRKVLLIASPNSAAITDFTKVCNNRRGGMEIYHLPIKTQGRSAENVILSSLRATNDIVKKYDIDTIVLTRGGGSKEDLIVFNSEKVVRAIHGLAKPTIVAIGHERDVTLSELVADLRAATPSQAAELVSLSSGEVNSQTGRSIQMIKNIFTQRKNRYKEYVNNNTARLSLIIRNEINQSLNAASGVDKILNKVFYEAGNTTKLLWNRIFSLVDQEVKKTARDIEVLDLKLDSVNPKKAMEKGFGIISQKDKFVSKVGDIERGKELELEMIDGKVELKLIE